MNSNDDGWFTAFFALALTAWIVGAWLTHIVVCIQEATWGFLVAGAIFVPIAWIHGTGLWFGWW